MRSIPVAAASGASAVTVNEPLQPAGSVLEHRFTPSGSHVVYRADAWSDGAFQVFRSPVSGGGPHDSLTIFSTHAFGLSSDGSRVAVLAGPGSLYGVPSDGSAPPTLLRPIAAEAPLVLTPDGGRVLFLLEQQSRDRLASVPTDGSAPPVLLGRSNVRVATDFRLTPDGGSVVFRDLGARERLMVQRVDGRGPREELASASAHRIRGFEIAPDGSGVLFVADLGVQGVFELYWSSLDEPWRAETR